MPPAKRRSPPAPSPRPARPVRPARAMLDPRFAALFELLEVPREDWGLPSGVVVAFAHSLKVPAGRFVNKPVRLRPFQLEFIRDVYNPRTVDGLRQRRQAVLSIGRRGGKTLLAAILVLCHLVGPMKRPNSTLISAATTRDQATLLFRYLVDMIRVSPAIAAQLKILRNTSRILHRNDGSLYRAMSSDAGGGFGQGLDVVIYDELAQAKSRKLYDMLMTSLGSQVEPLMIVISTQAPSNDHILSELIDYGGKIDDGQFQDDTFTSHVFTADDDCDLLDEKQWYKANPALGDYRDLTEMRTTMQRAARIPSLESTVRNLYLNQRVAAEAPFLSPNVWRLNEGGIDEALFRSGRPVYGGLDLSAKIDLSACVLAVADDDMALHLKTLVWTPAATLAARAAADRAPYDVWVDQGHMIGVPGTALDYDFIAADIGRATEGMALASIRFDRWRIDTFRKSCIDAGLFLPLAPHGQGFKDMAPAVDATLELAVEGKLHHGNHPVLRWCVSNCVLERDAAGNQKPTKARSWGRIDAAVAMVMAVAAARLNPDPGFDASAIIG